MRWPRSSRSSTQPALGAIRLAWWREALERLDTSPPPPEPRLQAVATELLPRGVTGAMLAELEDGWAALLDEEPDVERIGRSRARCCSRMARELLGGSTSCSTRPDGCMRYEIVRRRGLCADALRRCEEMHQLAPAPLPAPACGR